MTRPCVVLLSGGLDSATATACAKRDGYEVHALTIDYAQRHSIEIQAARDIAKAMGVATHTVFQIDLRRFGGSALTDAIEVPHGRSDDEISHGIPVTYVPARNLIFLSLAVAMAEVKGCTDVFIGVNAVDYSGYPDCRPEFIAAFAASATLATRIGSESSSPFRIHTPLAGLTKAQIIALGTDLGVPYQLTTSCYDPTSQGRPCGSCDSCLIRARGFEQAGLNDPTLTR